MFLGVIFIRKFLFLLIIVLIIIGTLFDYEITDKVNGNLFVFSYFFDVFGKTPSTVGLSLSILYFAVLSIKTNEIRYKITSILFFVLGLMISVSIFLTMFSYANSGQVGNAREVFTVIQFIISVILGILFTLVVSILLFKRDYNELISFKNSALFAFSVILIVMISTNIIKIIWGRPRYWFIIKENIDYIPWYMPSPFASGNEYKSFISGHTSNAMLMILITLLPIDYIQNNKSKFYILGITWGILTGLSRLFAGQHFLTDVVFSIVLVIFVYNKLKPNFKIA